MPSPSNFDYSVDGYNAGMLLVPETPVSIPALDAALLAYSSTSYPQQRLNTMTYRDKLYAARLHKVTVTQTLPTNTRYPV
jgi:hypothetical protein